jgi:tripartite-type tricarboxylate transporter receptor subunit TctC
LFDKLPYDPVNDFAPVARLVALPLMISANPNAPFKTLKELVEYVRNNPDKVTRASAGVANITNIGLLYFEDLAKIKMWHVPYAGDAAAMQALVTGEVQVYTTTVALMRQHVQAGRVRGLAILGKDAVRDGEVPDVPTVTEAGFPEFDVDSWYSLVVPAKTPKSVIDELNKAANGALKAPEVAAQLKKFGVVPTGGTPADLQKLIDDNRAGS